MKPSEALKLRPGDRVVVYGHALREVAAVHKTGPRSVEVDTRQIQSSTESFAAHRSEDVRLPTEADLQRYEKERAQQEKEKALYEEMRTVQMVLGAAPDQKYEGYRPQMDYTVTLTRAQAQELVAKLAGVTP